MPACESRLRCITVEERAAFAEVGHVTLRAGLSAFEVQHLEGRALSELPRLLDIGRAGETIVRFDNLNPDHRSILGRPALGALAAGLLGTSAVRLLYGGLYLKPPGAPSTDWHQDQTYFPIKENSVVSLWIPFAPVTAKSAPLLFASGSHRAGYRHIEDESIAPGGYAIVERSPLLVGDVSAHAGWTLHGGRPNTSTVERRALCVAYFADGSTQMSEAELMADAPRWREIGPQLKSSEYRPGAPLEGEFVPVVYRSEPEK